MLLVSRKIIVTFFLIIVLVPISVFLLSQSDLFGRIVIRNETNYYMLNYGQTYTFVDELNSWGIWEKNSMYDPVRKQHYTLKRVEIITRDTLGPSNTYRHYKDASKKTIVLSANYEVNKNTAIITLYINPNELHTLKGEILNYYVLNSVVLALHNNRVNKGSSMMGTRSILEKYVENPSYNPFTVTIQKP